MLSLFQIVAHEFQITQFPDPIGHKAEKRLKAQYPPKKGAMLQRPCQENLACGTKAQVEDPSSNHTANCPEVEDRSCSPHGTRSQIIQTKSASQLGQWL